MAMMAANGPSSSTVVVVEETPAAPPAQPVQTFRLKLRKPKKDKKVAWTPDTVDNENMNKKKSKCCCIYEKPKEFNESSSDSEDDECEHCKGHVERKHRKKPADGAEEEPDSPAGKSEEN